MPAPYAPADLVVAPISLFVDGDIVQEATTNPGVKAIADRGEGLRLSMAYAADATLFDPSRGLGSGITRLARKLSLAALAFQVMAAANDREIRHVDGIGTYQYIHGSVLAVDGYKIVTSAAGRWILQRQNLLIGIYGSSSNLTGFNNAILSTISAGPANTYVDAAGMVTVPNVAPGDFLVADLTCHGDLNAGIPAGSRGDICLAMRPVGGPEVIVDAQHFFLANGTEPKRASLNGFTTSAAALISWEVLPRLAYSAGPPVIFSMLDPFSLRIMHYRP